MEVNEKYIYVSRIPAGTGNFSLPKHLSSIDAAQPESQPEQAPERTRTRTNKNHNEQETEQPKPAMAQNIEYRPPATKKMTRGTGHAETETETVGTPPILRIPVDVLRRPAPSFQITMTIPGVANFVFQV